MNLWSFILLFGGWAIAFWLAVAIGHTFTQSRWRRRAEARNFDMMVERIRQQKF